MNDLVPLISARLKNKGIVIPQDNEWLNACVECFLENNPHSESKLLDFVHEQWTLADLVDVSSPSLPPTCLTSPKTTLTGKYAVQINYAVDVSRPFYKQLQTIRQPDSLKNVQIDCKKQEKDVKENESGRRCFKMEITDGITTVIGFEDVPLPMLANPIPGEKLLLSGPIEVRKGVLFLKPHNVTLLGGEVDTLLITNAVENILAREVGLPENPDPYSVANRENTSNSLSVANSQSSNLNSASNSQISSVNSVANNRSSNVNSVVNRRVTHHQQVVPPVSASSVVSSIQNPLDDGDDEALSFLAEAVEIESQTSVKSAPNPTARPPPAIQSSITNFMRNTKPVVKPPPPVFEIDDSFEEADFELIAAETASLAEQMASSQCKVKSFGSTRDEDNCRAVPNEDTVMLKDTKQPNLVECNGRYQNKRKEPCIVEHSRPKIPRSDNDHPTSSSSTDHFTNDRLDSNDKSLDWVMPPQKANLSHLRTSSERGKILVDYTDPTTLDLNLLSSQKQSQPPQQINKPHPVVIPSDDFPPKKYPSTITSRGRVIKIVNKLQLKDSKWLLTAVVEVKGVQMEMDFASESLDKIFTVTAKEITQQKSLLKTDLSLKEKFNGHLRESQRRIQSFDRDITMHFTNFISNPLVVDVAD